MTESEKQFQQRLSDLQASLDKLRADFEAKINEPEPFKPGWFKHLHRRHFVVYMTDVFPADSRFCLENKTGKDYGFDNSGNWTESDFWMAEHIVPATPAEVEAALIKEAKRIGYVQGVRLKRPWIKNGDVTLMGNNFWFDKERNALVCGQFEVFNNGQWAELVKPTITVTGDIMTITGLTAEQQQKERVVVNG